MTSEPLAVAAEPPARPAANDGDRIIRSLYVRCLGGVHVLAFLSLWVQIHGLVGDSGLLPVNAYLTRAAAQLGSEAYWRLPTLCWWNSSDTMLTALCAAGTLFGALLVCGVAPRALLCGLWITYLSLCTAGQIFLSFQWDTLLLEATFCSIFYAPRGRWLERSALPPIPLARWLVWLLAFKLMFLSGITKLLSGDESWWQGTALNFHYYTQPIPNWISWYVHHLPAVMHGLSLWVMFLAELVLPWLVFAGSRGRAAFAISTIVLMAAIAATGNYGFFNLLTAVICLPLLYDRVLQMPLQRRGARQAEPALRSRDVSAAEAPQGVIWASGTAVRPERSRAGWRASLAHVCCGMVLFASLLAAVREMVRTPPPGKMPALVSGTLNVLDRLLLSWGEPLVLDPIASFRTINGYGLFRVMTTRRPEIVVEYSRDGVTWAEYQFRYKPGQIDRAPPIVAPHMPRLDWQMWFAALNPRGNAGWMSSLASRILEGNPQTARLMGVPEIARNPPLYVQFAYYEYKFSAPDEQRRSGNWWVRTRLGELTGPLSKRE